VLIALFVVACVWGIPPLVDVVAQALSQSQSAAAGCRACGTVEDVREVTLGGTKDVSTVHGEGFAMFFALLQGKIGNGPITVYETEVQMQDGSVRLIREGKPPAWKHGDHVKVVMGQVRPGAVAANASSQCSIRRLRDQSVVPAKAGTQVLLLENLLRQIIPQRIFPFDQRLDGVRPVRFDARWLVTPT